jgi:hypothetical protein
MRFIDGVLDVVEICPMQIGDSERALQIMIYSKLSFAIFAIVEPILGDLG